MARSLLEPLETVFGRQDNYAPGKLETINMKRTIIHVFHIGAGPDVVIKAIATIAGLQNWWSKDTSGSAEKGGTIQFRFADVFKPDMKVIESNQTQVQWKCIAGEKEWLGDKFTFSIT